MDTLPVVEVYRCPGSTRKLRKNRSHRGCPRSPDFFDVAQFPELRFVGRRVEPRAVGVIDVIGDLTVKGTTREVTLRVEQLGQAKDRGAISARHSVRSRRSIARTSGSRRTRRWKPAAWWSADRVEIEAEIQAVKQVEAKVAWPSCLSQWRPRSQG